MHEVKFGGVTVQLIALLTYIVTPLKKPVAKEARGEKGNKTNKQANYLIYTKLNEKKRGYAMRKQEIFALR